MRPELLFQRSRNNVGSFAPTMLKNISVDAAPALPLKNETTISLCLISRPISFILSCKAHSIQRKHHIINLVARQR